jgi:hypothetical protein
MRRLRSLIGYMALLLLLFLDGQIEADFDDVGLESSYATISGSQIVTIEEDDRRDSLR